MEAVDRISVAILYRHQLFGEGIAHFLAGEPDVRVESISIDAGVSPADALTAGSPPDVVIFERGVPDAAGDLLGAFPDALVIDVALDAGPTYAWRRAVIGSGAEAIVAVIRAFAEDGRATTGGPPRGREADSAVLVTAGGA